MSEPDSARLTAWVEGRVQGVGFRWWVRARALERGLTGYAENLMDGRVKVVAEGGKSSCDALLLLLSDDPARRAGAGGDAGAGAGGDAGAVLGAAGAALRGRPGQVRRVTHRWGAASGGMAGFAER